MADIVLAWDSARGRADLVIEDGDLKMDGGLETEVILRLFCDRLAGPDDEIPDGSDDRRGWWGDAPLPGEADRTTPDLTGSKLWLRSRLLQLNETLRIVEDDAREALRPLREDLVVGAISVQASYPRLGMIELAIGLDQSGSKAEFAFAWPVA